MIHPIYHIVKTSAILGVFLLLSSCSFMESGNKTSRDTHPAPPAQPTASAAQETTSNAAAKQDAESVPAAQANAAAQQDPKELAKQMIADADKLFTLAYKFHDKNLNEIADEKDNVLGEVFNYNTLESGQKIYNSELLQNQGKEFMEEAGVYEPGEDLIQLANSWLFLRIIGTIAAQLHLYDNPNGWDYAAFNPSNNYLSIRHNASGILLYGTYDEEKKQFVFDLVKFIKNDQTLNCNFSTQREFAYYSLIKQFL